MTFQRYRVTGAGVVFGAVLALAGAAAFFTANNLLFLIFSAMLALLLVSGFLNRLVLSGLELELLLPAHVSARAPAPARVRLRNLKHFTASFSIELSAQGGGAGLTRPVYFPLIAGRATVEAPVQMTFERRGRHRESVFTLSSGFPFGFIRRATHIALKRETVVYPAVEASELSEQLLAAIQSEASSQKHTGGFDFHRIRPYLTMDSARLVDWKSTAHTGELQVREFAQDRQNAVEMFLDRSVPRECADAFEQVLENCASLVWLLAERGFQIQFASDDCELREPFAILRYLALVQPCDTALQATEPGSASIVFRVRS